MATAAAVTGPGFYELKNMDEFGPEDIKRPLPEKVAIFLDLFSWITHLCLGATAFCGFLFGLLMFVPFAAHVFLCTTGYIIVSLAVLTLSPHTGWTQRVKYRQRKTIHAAMQVIGAVLAIAGSAHIISVTPSDAALKTAHGVFGYQALACLCLNFLLGILNAFSSKIPRLEVLIKIFHSLLGSITMLTAFLSLLLAFKILFDGGVSNIGILIMVTGSIALIGVVTSALITVLRRLRCSFC